MLRAVIRCLLGALALGLAASALGVAGCDEERLPRFARAAPGSAALDAAAGDEDAGAAQPAD